MTVLTLLALLSAPVFFAPSAGAAELTADQAKAREIYSKLISFHTSKGMGQVPAMAEYLAGEFRRAGFADADIHILPLGETASLVVRYHGDGSGGKPILLIGHMDVVEAKREDWQRDPFTLIEENGFFFGRGTVDMKNGVTALTATFLRLKKEGFKPTRDLIIAFSGDEETDGATATNEATKYRELVDAEYALNADGSGGSQDETGKDTVFTIRAAEKTYASYELTTRNPGGHSSAPRPDNAIYDLAKAIDRLAAYQFPVMWNDTTLGYYAATGKVTPGELGKAMSAFARDQHDAAAIKVLSDTPYEVGRIRTTCIPTLLRGGHADNALPQSATVTVNCRIFPGVSVASVAETLKATAGPAVELTVLGKPVSSDASPIRPDLFKTVARIVHEQHPGVPVVPSQASGASDGVFFRAVGIPTYEVAPAFMKDSDSFAHGLNERLPVKAFYDDLEYWVRLVKALAGRH
jgi:acetylornithine deacetylase/succinyl-diaminopimelate desuccinylase-like protein